MSSRGEIQTAYQIRVGSSAAQLAAGHAGLWDSGKVLSSAVAGIPYEGRSLRSREICYWQVRVWNSCDHCGPWSSVARFETGLLTNEEWGAAWIWCDKKEESEDYVYFRKSTFLPNKPMTRARVYVTAGHRHEFHVNGKPVGKGPNFAYPQFQYYQTFDITSCLNPGKENSFGLLCHWYGAGQGRPYSHWGLLFEAVIDFEDGSSVELASDRSWKTAPRGVEGPPGKDLSEELPKRKRDSRRIDRRTRAPGWLEPPRI